MADGKLCTLCLDKDEILSKGYSVINNPFEWQVPRI